MPSLVDPVNEGVWRGYLASLSRRWGGSYEEQEEAARSAQRYAPLNPRLQILLSYADGDLGDDLAAAGQHAEALAAYTRALASFESDFLLLHRARERIRVEDWAGAAADLDRAIEINPFLPELHYRRALIHVQRFESADAVSAARRAVELAPTRAEYADYLRQCNAWHAHLERESQKGSGQRFLERVLSELLVHAHWAMLIVLSSWGGYQLARALRRRARSRETQRVAAEDRREVVARLLRVYLWFLVIWHAWNWVARFGRTGPAEFTFDVPITLIAFVGALAYAHGLRVGVQALWQVWTWLFPIAKVIFHVVFESATLAEWPSWGFVHLYLMPAYLALFQYAYRSERLWGNVPVSPVTAIR